MKSAIGRTYIFIVIVITLSLAGCFLGPRNAAVHVKFDIVGGDNNFAASVYVQEVDTGATFTVPYDPHTPYIVIPIKKPGRYVFYARLVEAPDDYHYGFTSYQTVGYGHMTRGGTGDPATESLVALDVKLGEKYKVYINDYRARLPEAGKPVTVPWRSLK